MAMSSAPTGGGGAGVGALRSAAPTAVGARARPRARARPVARRRRVGVVDMSPPRRVRVCARPDRHRPPGAYGARRRGAVPAVAASSAKM